MRVCTSISIGEHRHQSRGGSHKPEVKCGPNRGKCLVRTQPHLHLKSNFINTKLVSSKLIRKAVVLTDD